MPARIPDLICLATMGSPFGNSASTLHTKRQELFPKFTTRYCVHATNDFPNGASGLRAAICVIKSKVMRKGQFSLSMLTSFFETEAVVIICHNEMCLVASASSKLQWTERRLVRFRW